VLLTTLATFAGAEFCPSFPWAKGNWSDAGFANPYFCNFDSGGTLQSVGCVDNGSTACLQKTPFLASKCDDHVLTHNINESIAHPGNTFWESSGLDAQLIRRNCINCLIQGADPEDFYGSGVDVQNASELGDLTQDTTKLRFISDIGQPGLWNNHVYHTKRKINLPLAFKFNCLRNTGLKVFGLTDSKRVGTHLPAYPGGAGFWPLNYKEHFEAGYDMNIAIMCVDADKITVEWRSFNDSDHAGADPSSSAHVLSSTNADAEYVLHISNPVGGIANLTLYDTSGTALPLQHRCHWRVTYFPDSSKCVGNNDKGGAVCSEISSPNDCLGMHYGVISTTIEAKGVPTRAHIDVTFNPKENNLLDLGLCNACPKGEFASVTSHGCNDCPAGQYQDQIGKGACKACPAGTYNDQQGQGAKSDCTNCTVGKYNDQVGQDAESDCKVCYAGTYNDQQGQGAKSDCIGCGTGRYSNHFSQTAAAACSPCAIGKYQNQTAKRSCINCAVGKYNDQTGQGAAADCKNCTVGRYGDQEGQDEESDCIGCGTGRYSNQFSQTADSACKGCAAGKFADQAAQAACKNCAVGQWGDTQGSDTDNNCIDCVVGRYGITEAASSVATCKNCPVGQYQNKPAQTVCTGCTAGMHQSQEAQAACNNCVAGKYGTTTASTSSDSCIDCDRGKYGDAPGQAACTNCGNGTYNNQTGQGAAADYKNCPEGNFPQLVRSRAARHQHRRRRRCHRRRCHRILKK
jgi:hypothetical protein